MLQGILLQNIPELPLHFGIQDIEGLLWMCSTIRLIAFKKVVIWFSVPLQNRNKRSDSLFLAHFTVTNTKQGWVNMLLLLGRKVLLHALTHCHTHQNILTHCAPRVTVVSWLSKQSRETPNLSEGPLNEISIFYNFILHSPAADVVENSALNVPDPDPAPHWNTKLPILQESVPSSASGTRLSWFTSLNFPFQ